MEADEPRTSAVETGNPDRHAQREGPEQPRSASSRDANRAEEAEDEIRGTTNTPSIVMPSDFNQMIDPTGLPRESRSGNQTDFCTPRPGTGPAPLKGRARIEAWLETLVAKSPLMRKILSRIYLPLSFHSGLTMKKVDSNTFAYVLPFRRFNKNWYKAMAGAALVANSEIAAGLYLMGELKGRWTVVCRELSYRFLRPCFGPAVYRITPEQDIGQLMALGNEFNVDLVIDIMQQVSNMSLKSPPRVGRCHVTFHVTPKGSDGNEHMHKRHLLRTLRNGDSGKNDS